MAIGNVLDVSYFKDHINLKYLKKINSVARSVYYAIQRNTCIYLNLVLIYKTVFN